MTTTKLENMRSAANIDLEKLWYVPNPKLRGKAAAEQAIRTVQWINSGRGLDAEPNEEGLFVALHTCAYRATRKPASGKQILMAERLEWAHRWEVIRSYIVEKNMGLVYTMIGRFNSRDMDDDDLLSDALYALTRAVDRFNPWRGFRFSTYACNVIGRALMRRGKQESNYRRLFPVQHDATFERPEPSRDTQTDLYVERLNRALKDNLGELTELESKILAQRFPREAENRLTFQEIGNAIGLSKERVRQIQNIALNKLREVLDTDPTLQ